MAANNIPSQFKFGPYSFPTFPQKHAFRSQFPLLPEQQCLVDNLFNQPKTTQFLAIIHALVGHLTNLNGQILSQQKHSLDDPTKPILSPAWRERERLLIVENGNKAKRIAEMELKLKNMEEELTKTTSELNLLKTEWEKEWNQKQEFLEVFPEQLDEVKEKIREIVLRDTKQNILATQQRLRALAETKEDPSNGLALCVLAFKENKHPQQYCKCDKGFHFVQASIDLRTWKDIDSFLSFKNLFTTGMIRRAMVTSPRQVIEYIEPVSWGLAYILQQILKTDVTRNGYINLEFETVPQSLTFPDAARHTILLTTHDYKISIQKPLEFSYSLLKGHEEEQYTLARVYLQAAQPLISHIPRYDVQLFTEEKNMKVFGSPYLHKMTYDVPFLNHVTEDVPQMFHVQSIHQYQVARNYGDYLDTQEIEIPPGHAPTGMDLAEFDDRQENNNMILEV